jgi:hypothetical protein
LVEATIVSTSGLPVNLIGTDVEVASGDDAVTLRVTQGRTIFDTIAGKSYTIRPRQTS